MALSPEEFVLGMIHLSEDAARLRAFSKRQLRECFDRWRAGATPIPPEDRIATTSRERNTTELTMGRLQEAINQCRMRANGSMPQMLQPFERYAPPSDAALAMRYAMSAFRPGAGRVSPESWSDSPQTRPWYDTLPDDMACSLEEWNAKVDALLDDVAEFHRAIDGEDGEAE